jgi:hypothetical protein
MNQLNMDFDLDDDKKDMDLDLDIDKKDMDLDIDKKDMDMDLDLNTNIIIYDVKFKLLFHDENINIYVGHESNFDNLKKFLTILDYYLIKECKGSSNINDIEINTSLYKFYIITDKKNNFLSHFKIKKVPKNDNCFELWDVCRFRNYVPSDYKNITKYGIRKVIQRRLSNNKFFMIWLSVDISDIQTAFKLIEMYSDIGFSTRNICSSKINSPSGIKLSINYERMNLNINTILPNQNIRNISNFIWDYNYFKQLSVTFYLSKRLVILLRNSLQNEKEYGFGVYMNLKETNNITNCKISLIRGSQKFQLTGKNFEYNKSCIVPPLEINSFSHLHTHPKVCYTLPEHGLIGINPFSSLDINNLLQANYRFILTPSLEGLHFIKLIEKVRDFIYLGNDTQKYIDNINTEYKTNFEPKILKYIKQTDKSPQYLTSYYKDQLYKDFQMDGNHIFYYKLIEWTDSNMYLYNDEIIV